MNNNGAYVKKVSDAYREASKTALLVSARAVKRTNELIPITTGWAQPNLATNQSVSFSKQLLIDSNSLKTVHEFPIVPENGLEMKSTFGDGDNEVTIIVRKTTAEDCQNIELWSRNEGLRATFNLKEFDVHGKIYTDSEFGALELSEDRKTLMYIAEKKMPKNKSFLFQGEVGENV